MARIVESLREHAANATFGIVNAPRGVCLEAADEIERLTKWQPMEAAPKKKRVLGFRWDAEQGSHRLPHYFETWWTSWPNDGYWIGHPLCWLPLPEAPQILIQ